MINIIRKIKKFMNMHTTIFIAICILLIDLIFFSILTMCGAFKGVFENHEEDFVRMEETTKEIIDSSKNIKAIDYSEFEKRNYEIEVDYNSELNYYNLEIKKEIENNNISIEVDEIIL